MLPYLLTLLALVMGIFGVMLIIRGQRGTQARERLIFVRNRSRF